MGRKVIITVSNDLCNEQRMHKTALWLTSRGFEVLLLGRKKKKSDPISEQNYATKRIKVPPESGIGFYIWLNLRLFAFMLFKKLDIVVSVDTDTLLAARLLRVFRRFTWVYDSHEYFTEVPELVQRPRKKRIWQHVESHCIPKTDKCYTVCDSIANIYADKYKKPFEVVRNCPILAGNSAKTIQLATEFELLKASGQKILLYQGAMNVGRGIEQVFEALQLLEGLVFVMIGSGDCLEALKTRATTLNIQHKVMFLGHKNFLDLPSYTRHAALGISLEQNLGLNYYYALPNKLFDYLHAGVPVLCSNLPEMKNIVEQYGVGRVCYDFSPLALATQIHEMIFFEGQKYTGSLQKASSKLNWKVESEKFVKIYE